MQEAADGKPGHRQFIPRPPREGPWSSLKLARPIAVLQEKIDELARESSAALAQVSELEVHIVNKGDEVHNC